MIKNYKLFGEVHKMVYFVEGTDVMNSTKRYERIEEVKLEDLLHKDFQIGRDCKLVKYKQFGELPISEETLTDMNMIKYGGYVNPIIKIKEDNIYVSTIIEIDNTEPNNYPEAQELLKEIKEKKALATTCWLLDSQFAPTEEPEVKEEKKSFFERLKNLVRGNNHD